MSECEFVTQSTHHGGCKCPDFEMKAEDVHVVIDLPSHSVTELHLK